MAYAPLALPFNRAPSRAQPAAVPPVPPAPPRSIRPPKPLTPPPAFEAPPMAQFVVLSLLLHALAILVFGAPSGGSREGRALWGALNVTLLAPPLEVAPALKVERQLTLTPLPRASARRAPTPAPVDLGIARQIERVPPPRAPAETPRPAPTADKAPEAVQRLIDRIATPERTPEAPPPLQVPLPTETQAARPPPVEMPVAPPPEPAPPPVAVTPPPAAPPRVQEAAPLEIPAPARVERPAEPPPLAAPLVQPLAPVAPPTPQVQRPPMEVQALPAEGAPAPPKASLPPAERAPPPAPPPAAARPIERAPALDAPSLQPSPFKPSPLPDAGARPREEPSSNYDPTAPSIDLDAARKRAGQLAREGTGNRALLPFAMPPVPKAKSKLESAIENARKPDCKTYYQSLGLAAIAPLIANEFGEGKCKW